MKEYKLGQKEYNSLRILHITHGVRWAGIEAHITNILPELNRLGIIVHCVTLSEGELVESLLAEHISVKVFQRERKMHLSLFCKLRKYMK